MKKIKLSDIKFDNKVPKDLYLLDLLRKAYKGELMCHMAIIKSEAIQPFSDYKPNPSPEIRAYFDNEIKGGNYPPIYVYPKGNRYIMSDDYNIYYLYIENGFKNMMCVVLGEAKSKYVLEKSKPFKLQSPPQIQILNPKKTG